MPTVDSTYTDTSVYEVAREGFYQMVRDDARSFLHMDEPEYLDYVRRMCDGDPWEEYAKNPTVRLPSLPERGVALSCYGGATVKIEGNIGDDAIILCRGGGAKVVVHGNVGERVRIYARGGGANVTIHGTTGFQSEIHSQGGAAWARFKGRVHPSVTVKVTSNGNVWYE